MCIVKGCECQDLVSKYQLILCFYTVCQDGRIILRRIFEKWNGKHGLDRSCSGEGQVAGSFECGNEPSGSIKWGGIYWVDEDLLAFQEGFCSMEFYEQIPNSVWENGKMKQVPCWEPKTVKWVDISEKSDKAEGHIRNRGSIPKEKNRFFSLLKRVRGFMCPPNLIFSGY
jgi:hypothetical protein